MSLEKDINQAKFRSEYQKATVNIIYTHNWLLEKIKLFLEPADITQKQFNILRILRGESPLSTLKIRERMLDKMSDTSRLVDRLVLKGLAEKKSCKQDKRLVDITITEKGLEVLSSIDMQSESMDDIVGKLTDEDAKMLNTLLDKLRG